MAIKTTITQGIGYTGKRGERAYVAEITGTDAQYGFCREFVDAISVTRDHFGRSRYTRTYHYELSLGLYEIAEHGERSYRVAWAKQDGTVCWTAVSAERAQNMAVLMDGGATCADARRATKPVNA